ncbi:nuclear transport factor 2 family protein [Dactylosporangium sp. CA-092794]|uniref:nuclear transport factor 2 family protein n=1 Tax=Dactylosporangium sp. CA-092794 TaxID=3239929 RepID=UPI003D8E8D0D
MSVDQASAKADFPPKFWATQQGLIDLKPLGAVPFPPEQIRDRMLIHEAFYRFAMGHDENRPDVVLSCMTEDIQFEGSLGSATPFNAFYGYAALEKQLSTGIGEMYGQRRHCMTNIIIDELTDTTAKAYANSVVTRAAQGLILQAAVMYDTRLRKEADGFWRFTRFFIGMDEYAEDPGLTIPKPVQR